MSSELIHRVRGDVPVKKEDREVVARARQLYDEAQLTALKIEAAVAVGGVSLEGIDVIDRKCQTLAKDDPRRDLLFSDIEAETLEQVKRLQRSLFSAWGF